MKDMDLIVDSSVLVKWFNGEENSDKAIEIRNAVKNNLCRIIVPDLAIYELSNALKYANFSYEEISKAADSILEVEGIFIFAPTRDIVDKTNEIMMQSDSTFYDSLFAAMAAHFGIMLITADKKFYDKVKDKNFCKIILLKDFK